MSGIDIGGIGRGGGDPWRTGLRPVGLDVARPVQDPRRGDGAAVEGTAEGARGFGGMLTDALETVQSLQADTRAKTRGLALGEDVDVHDVMIAANKSEVAFNLVLEVRNKMVEAWEKLSRSVM
ncbi:MAG: flagellar hook-basal body complex protein FliE [Phycisphaerales bacterium]|jgi:flagellar hook-basal body complex protein FliE|nr:flagellar hook-basal body complex protein FliE [Phycisphaerales bacterium]